MPSTQTSKPPQLSQTPVSAAVVVKALNNSVKAAFLTSSTQAPGTLRPRALVRPSPGPVQENHLAEAQFPPKL
uniref:7.5 kDa protein n=1 Tax=Human parvovirus B19 TaxID=10798 RepID=Q2I000_PAVHB|nr:7.5 kDa protein [Human parvovirus B19]ABC87247.1 7.5 kDa protein [Human parvovirus B19]